jgi:hypothetical protein
VIADEDFDYRDTTIELTPFRFILRRWEIRDDTDLLPFFNLKTADYVALNNADTTLSDSLFKGKISLVPKVEKSFVAYSRIFIPVEIINNSGRKIPSLPVDANYFRMEIKNGDHTSSMDIPFDIDLTEKYTEVISCPLNGIEKPMNVHVKMIVGGREVAAAEAVLN